MDIHTLRKGFDRALFYTKNFAYYYLPKCMYGSVCIPHLTQEEYDSVRWRTDYYVRLPHNKSIDMSSATRVADFKYPFGNKKKFATYFFDLYPFIRTMQDNMYFHYIFGDINREAGHPSFVKARPITVEATNNVICKLNQVRHFRFINDKLDFRQKKDMTVFRNIVRQQPNRTLFIKRFSGHPACDVGQINDDGITTPRNWIKPYMPISSQLNYKFIACIEGHDVATNLKWVMSSNSIAIMPRPKFESWFMEGTLVPDYHYIEIKDDFSDLTEKMDYYINHQDKAEQILHNAHRHVEQFKNKRLERVIQQEVVRQYFIQTQQLAEE